MALENMNKRIRDLLEVNGMKENLDLEIIPI